MNANDQLPAYVTNVEGPFFNSLEPAEEVTDDESVENFKVECSHPLQSSTSSCVSNLTVTPFRDPYMENNEFLSQLNGKTIKVPIVGYEIMEERARFTVYKLRVEHTENGNSWVVYRRYTDFVRLCNAIKTSHPNVAALLPRKRWFGNNFDPNFLNERIRGLQLFINGVLESDDLLKNTQVQDFLCLNESALDTEQFLEDSRAICDALSETIYHLRNQLKDKDIKIIELNEKLYSQDVTIASCIEFIKKQSLSCSGCSEKLNDNLKKLVQNETKNDNSNLNEICDNSVLQ